MAEDKAAALRERLAKATASIEAKGKTREQRELEALELEVRDAEELAKAAEEHGLDNLRRVRTPGGSVIVKRPSRAEFSRWLDSEKSTTATTLVYVRPHVVSDPSRFDALLDRYPALLGHCLRACNQLAGVEQEQDEGK